MSCLKSVVVDDDDLGDIAVVPAEADAPLVVDADAVLTTPIAFQRFQPIGRRDTQILETGSGIEHAQLASGNRLDIGRQPARALATPDLFGFLIDKAPDHTATITALVI